LEACRPVDRDCKKYERDEDYRKGIKSMAKRFGRPTGNVDLAKENLSRFRDEVINQL
jgi:hypothetical protein